MTEAYGFGDYRRAHFSWFDWFVFREEQEILDLRPHSPEAASVVRDLERASLELGVAAAVARRVIPMLRDVRIRYGRTPRLLELCCGNGWFCRYLTDWASAHDLPLEITGLDLSDDAIKSAVALSAGRAIQWNVGDALDTPFTDRQFDIVVNLQSLHHFSPVSVPMFVREASRIGSSFFVFDLRRTPYGRFVMRALSPFYSWPFIHDAIVSHRRAYSVGEIRFLLAEAQVSVEVRPMTAVGMGIFGSHASAVTIAKAEGM